MILILNFAFNVALEVVTSMSRDREAIYRLYDALHSYKQAMAGQVGSMGEDKPRGPRHWVAGHIYHKPFAHLL